MTLGLLDDGENGEFNCIGFAEISSIRLGKKSHKALRNHIRSDERVQVGIHASCYLGPLSIKNSWMPVKHTLCVGTVSNFVEHASDNQEHNIKHPELVITSQIHLICH